MTNENSSVVQEKIKKSQKKSKNEPVVKIDQPITQTKPETSQIQPKAQPEMVKNPDALDYLMWVGKKYTVESFFEETDIAGACKRLPFIPNGLRKGSKVFLGFKQTRHVKDKEGKIKHKCSPVLAGYFVVDHIEIIVLEKSEELEKMMKEKGIEFEQVTVQESEKQPDRICGNRLIVGSMYAVSNKIVGNAIKFQESVNALGLKFFRGIKEFNYDDWKKWIDKIGKEAG